MKNTYFKSIARKTLKVGGAGLSLGWSFLAGSVLLIGTSIVLVEKTDNLKKALKG